jgi:DNA-binding XRE family transcriptional regulator
MDAGAARGNGSAQSSVGTLPADAARERAERTSQERIGEAPRAGARPGSVTLFTDRSEIDRRLRSELERAGVPRSSVAVSTTAPELLPETLEARTVVVIDAGASGYDADEVLAHLGLARAIAAVPVVLAIDDEGRLADVEELVDDLCGGLVARRPEELAKVAAAVVRKAAALARPRFEYLTVSPRTVSPRTVPPRTASPTERRGTGASALASGTTAGISGGTSSATSSSGTIAAEARSFAPGSSPGTVTAAGGAADATPFLAIFADGTCALATRPVAIEDDGSEVVAISMAEDARSARVELASGRELTLLASELFQRALPADEPRPLSAEEILAQIDGPTLGSRLRTLRLAAGLTQAQLAERTGIHRPNIARVEAGRHTPSLETIARLAAAIGVHATRVLQG